MDGSGKVIPAGGSSGSGSNGLAGGLAGLSGGLGGGQLINQLGPLISGIGNGVGSVMNAIPGMVSGIGQGINGLTHMFHGNQQHSWYRTAENDFLGQGDSGWAHIPFQGSGAAPSLWATTSQDYVDDYERPDFVDLTDGDGNITSYIKKQPKQSRRLVASDPLDTMGYFNPSLNLSVPDLGDDSGDGGGGGQLNLPGRKGKGKGPKGMAGAGAAAEDAAGALAAGGEEAAGALGGLAEGAGALGGLAEGAGAAAAGEGAAAAAGGLGLGELAMEALPLLLLANTEDDGSDIVRQFQASGGGALNAPSSGGGSYSDDAIAAQARGLLRTAGRVYSPAEQRELEEESHVLGARNLNGLDLEGTHYL